jgi:DNA-binding MarR family transcriptional regulator
MASLLPSAQHYLAGLLPGIVTSAAPWQSTALPYFLRDAFELAELKVHGHPVILAATKEATSQQTLRKMLHRLQNIAGCRVLYVAPHLSAYERKRLLAERVEFVVPGSQLFAPSLAMDLRENTSSSAPPTEVLALLPATQAVLLTLLLKSNGAMPTLAVARSLGYSPMTASRANRELEAAGLAKVNRVGSKSTLTLADTRQEIWERARPLMRTPVTKSLHVIGPKDRLKLAGETALAELTLLTHPSETVFAIGPNDWRTRQSEFTISPEADSNTSMLQIWSYHPWLLDDETTVDPLSLILSLQNETDERVQITLEELENTTWQRLED